MSSLISHEDINGKIYKIWNQDTDSKDTDYDAYCVLELRNQRNLRLSQSDWTQNRDVTLSNDSVWKTYREELRDLPSTASPTLDEAGKLTNITWPTKPS